MIFSKALVLCQPVSILRLLMLLLIITLLITGSGLVIYNLQGNI